MPRVVKYPRPGSRVQGSVSWSWVKPASSSIRPTVAAVWQAVGQLSMKSNSFWIMETQLLSGDAPGARPRVTCSPGR